MRLLIDGNNLLHASDIFPTGKDLSIAAAQQAFVAAILAAMTPAEAAATVIVFDGPAAPSEALQASGLRVVHPRRGQDADEVMEGLLASPKEPSRLLVVSSDHRIQRAARQAGASYIDSEIYWRQWKQRQRAALNSGIDEEKPPLAGDDVQGWLDLFRQAGE